MLASKKSIRAFLNAIMASKNGVNFSAFTQTAPRPSQRCRFGAETAACTDNQPQVRASSSAKTNVGTDNKTSPFAPTMPFPGE
jgi:hypothetical protein